METMEDVKSFEKELIKNGFKKIGSGEYTNDLVTFIIYGLGPYKVSVRKRFEKRSVIGAPISRMMPATLEEVFDLIPDSLREYILYTMDSFHSERTGFVVSENIGIGIINPRGLTSMNIVYK